MVKLHASFLSCGTFLAFAMARCGGKTTVTVPMCVEHMKGLPRIEMLVHHTA
ncbi:hypothetical protein M758_6G044500 [Ceratodon purpureus]|nr:hypothetical protein M758_6G044500 [Ceratodon purpureus]